MKRKGFGILFFVLFLWFGMGTTGFAAQEGWEEYDFSEIELVLEEELGTGVLSFPDLVQALISGDVETFGQTLKSYVGQMIMAEIRVNQAGLWQILALSMIGALFANLMAVFEKEGISEIGLFVTYLLLTSLLLTSFLQALQVAEQFVCLILNFVSALLPVFLIAVASAGGSLTALAFHEFLMIVISAVEWVLAQVLLPLVRIFVVIGVINHLTKEEIFSKTKELMQTILNGGLKAMVGIVTGYSLVQNLILPQVDAVKTGALTKIVGALPGLGNSASSLTSLVLGSGNLIKNGIGTAALVTLVFLSVLPLGKLVVIYLMYAAAQALMEPISDKRILGYISSVAFGVKLLFQIAGAAFLLFMILIALLCACTNLAR